MEKGRPLHTPLTPFIMRKPLALAAVLSLVPAALAQQFNQVGTLPGVNRWSEGVEAADVDGDGDLDLFFADGDGFSGPGPQRQNILLINQLIETGFPTFTDESVARLGTNLSIAKGVTTADVNGDGFVDALFANAWETDPPFLYINDGTGNFTEEAAARGLTTNLSSGAAQFGDLDDDGDLDLIINDAYLGSGSGKPRLYFNDGAGNFTENAAALGAVDKQAQMDVQLVDFDNDWDLDFFGVCRAGNGGENHYLMLNQGDGTFVDASSTFPSTSNNAYEADVGDLDGDNDIDTFFVSLSGFGEGAISNDLVPSGSLSFTSQGSLGGFVDDNEVALFDYDVDGDYDIVIGSLGNTEALYRNDGGFTFVSQSTQIQSISDSSLDITVADINNDGAYDLITANGESNQPQWNNKIYVNSGAVDDMAPVLTALDAPAEEDPLGPFKVRAKVRDQVMDDGVNYVTAKAHYVINTGLNAASVDIQAGGFVPAVLNVTAGATVTFTNSSGANQSVASTTSPYTYDSGTLTNGQTYQQVYVTPGTYDILSTSGLTAQVVVSGSNDSVDGLKAGGNIYRFLMTDTTDTGTGIELVYELRFTDWPGNELVTNNGVISLADCTAANYCTAGLSAAGCQALLSSAGTPSATAASGFTLTANTVEGQKDGLFYFGTNGQQSNPWGNGTSFQCVVPPTIRTPLQTGVGTIGAVRRRQLDRPQRDLVRRAARSPTKNPGSGAVVDAQFWYRDPANTSNQTTSLSDAIEFTVCP